MTNVTIRDVPEDVHRELTRRADRRGQSLQVYLRGELAELAERITEEEWTAQVRTRLRESGRSSPMSSEEAVQAVHDGRRYA